MSSRPIRLFIFFFFNDTATTEIYTLSYTTLFRSEPGRGVPRSHLARGRDVVEARGRDVVEVDRKSTRLNSSHLVISYAVFCLKKKNFVEVVRNFVTVCAVTRLMAWSPCDRAAGAG